MAKTLRETILGKVATLFAGTKAGTGTTYSDPFDIANLKMTDLFGAFILNVSAVSGTTPTLDVSIHNYDPVSDQLDTGAVVTFTQKTAISTEWKYTLETAKKLARFVKVKFVVAGTNPSFTLTVAAHLKP